MTTETFQRIVWDHYAHNRRDMPWRSTPTPYYVLVSEIMLQQTQVPRVLPKFAEFVQRFPDIAALAQADLGDVLRVWSGLGYNRRAKFLWQTARAVRSEYGGELPRTVDQLVMLPGIGPNTAGAIVAYAFNQPAVFVETNIRTVFIHHYFADHAERVSDAQLRDLVISTMVRGNPREWYWALMDYGTHLKSTVGAQLQRVRGHRPQSRFAGSRRQIRGRVLRVLLAHGSVSRTQLAGDVPDARLPEVIEALANEGLIRATATHVHLTGAG